MQILHKITGIIVLFTLLSSCQPSTDIKQVLSKSETRMAMMDTIANNCKLPDLAIGESVYIEDAGAYTTAAASNFNGFQRTPCEYIMRY